MKLFSVIGVVCLVAATMAVPASYEQERYYDSVLSRSSYNYSGMSTQLFKLGQDAVERINDLPKRSAEIMRNIPYDLRQALSNANEYFAMTSKEIASAPAELIAKPFNQLFAYIAAKDALPDRVSPRMDEMDYYLITKDDNETYPMTSPESLVNSPNYRKNLGITVVVTGWKSEPKRYGSSPLDKLVNAYRCRADTNLLVVDAARFADTFYLWATYNTEAVGTEIAKAIMLLKQHVNVPHIHMIGHSLGAQIIGSAGRLYQDKTGKVFDRCTALDPAQKSYEDSDTIEAISRGDCDFVEVLHTNPGVLGTKQPSGDVDFYANGADPYQPGCMDLVCSHNRALELYAESLYPGNEENFIAVGCNSLENVKNGRCKTFKVPMGIVTPKQVKGNFFFETNTNSPYGKDYSGRSSAVKHQCNTY